MKQHGDVILRNSEQRRNVVAGSLFEEPERDDGALNFAELGHARAKPNGVFRACQELLLENELVVHELVSADLGVRTRAKVSPSLIACGVANDGDEHGGELGARVDLTRLQELEQGAEGVLNAVDGFLGREPFLACDPREPATLVLRHA